MPDLLPLLFLFLFVVPSSILHEYAHGWMANQLGDSTAKYAGRLTLNPFAHVDLYGTILMPLLLFFLSRGQFMFAYAKPVPFNPYNLRDQKWGPVWVAFAGPISNFVLAMFFGFIVRFLPPSNFQLIVSVIVYANVLLGVFNLLPIPPLDGSKLLYALLPSSMNKIKLILDQYGIIILLFFIFFLPSLISPIISYLFNVFTGGLRLF